MTCDLPHRLRAHVQVVRCHGARVGLIATPAKIREAMAAIGATWVDAGEAAHVDYRSKVAPTERTAALVVARR